MFLQYMLLWLWLHKSINELALWCLNFPFQNFFYFWVSRERNVELRWAWLVLLHGLFAFLRKTANIFLNNFDPLNYYVLKDALALSYIRVIHTLQSRSSVNCFEIRFNWGLCFWPNTLHFRYVASIWLNASKVSLTCL